MLPLLLLGPDYGKVSTIGIVLDAQLKKESSVLFE